MNTDLGHGFIEIQGIKCYLPPKPDKRQILNYDVKKKDQKWKKIPLPVIRARDVEFWDGSEPKPNDVVSWAEAERQEHIKIYGTDPFDVDKNGKERAVKGVEINPDYSMECLENFRSQELDRLINGVWCYINGEAYYIPGPYYLYLNYWKLQDGPPEFRYTDLELFWFWEHVRKSKNFLGVVYITMRGVGKCLGRGTKIRMFDGSLKNVEDVINGDVVMGINSSPRMVSGVNSGSEEMFEIIPNKGNKFTCNGSHILSLIYNGSDIDRTGRWVVRNKYGFKRNEINNISVNDYLKLDDSTKNHLVLFRSGWNDHLENKNHLIPPYIIGAFLGDGTSSDGSMTIAEGELVDIFTDYSKSLGYKLSHHGKYQYRISNRGTGKKENTYLYGLRDLDLLSNKHIPSSYLNDGRENRLELLAGLIDTDGYKGDHHYEITQKRKRLADDIVTLSRSLGFYTTIKSKIATMRRKDGSIYSCEVWRININGNLNEIPCRLKRKSFNGKIFNQRTKSNRTGFKVNPIGLGDYYGFEVDGDHLFLLEDGTVTHNTSVSACIAYYEAITNRDAWVGIQSKSDDDAGIMFKDKVLLPVSKLPEFLVPIHRNKGKADITRQSQLEFTPPSRGSMDVRLFNKMKDECLYTTMLYRNSGEFAADGVTWKLLLQNEIGKTDPNKVADVYKRLLVNKFTVFRGNKKLGNIFAESSVEDMTVGGAECLQVWKNSNQYSLNANNMTNTGLVGFFRSALDATYFDEYGFPDRERSKAWHDVERARLKSDSKSYISYIQKNPYTVDEAFWINADKCIYNAEILIEAKRKISDSPKPLTIRGDIKWKVKDKEAEFVSNNENGKWHVSFLDFEPNLVQINNGSRITFTPKAGHKRVMAFDPYVLRTEELSEERKGSQAAATVYSKQDFNTPEDFCDTIIADYVYRHDDPMDSYEDIICACFFFGCPVLIEKNKTNAWDYFRGRGYHWGYEGNENSFIMLRPESTLTDYATKQTSGITSTAVTIQHYVLSTQHHIQNHGHKLKHLRVIDAWLKFNPEKTKEHDLAVAASYSVVAAEKVIKSEGRVIDLSTIPAFRTYNNSGSKSQAN